MYERKSREQHLEDAVNAVILIHHPVNFDGVKLSCAVCVEVDTFDKYEQTYPCPTIQALGEFAPNTPDLAKEDK